MVVIAAYLAVHGDAVPATRRALLDELVGHEDAYWQRTVDPKRTSGVLRRRVVALATLDRQRPTSSPQPSCCGCCPTCATRRQRTRT